MIDFLNNIITTLLDNRIDYNSVSRMQLNIFWLLSTSLCGLISLFILNYTNAYAYKSSILRFQKKYPDEKIIYASKNSLLYIAVIGYIWGASFGNSFFPVVFFKNALPSSSYSVNTWLIWLIDYVFVPYFIIVRFNMVCIFSNKRIKALCIYDIGNKLFKTIDIIYRDIANIDFSSFLGISALYIVLKNNNARENIYCFTDLKKIRNIITKQIGYSTE